MSTYPMDELLSIQKLRAFLVEMLFITNCNRATLQGLKLTMLAFNVSQNVSFKNFSILVRYNSFFNLNLEGFNSD